MSNDFSWLCRVLLYNLDKEKKETRFSERRVYMELEEIIDEIILENEELFNKEELLMINRNLKVIKKIYLLGLINGKQIYGKN